MLVALFIERPTPFLEEFFEGVASQNYPKSRIDLYVHNLVSIPDISRCIGCVSLRIGGNGLGIQHDCYGESVMIVVHFRQLSGCVGSVTFIPHYNIIKIRSFSPDKQISVKASCFLVKEDKTFTPAYLIPLSQKRIKMTSSEM